MNFEECLSKGFIKKDLSMKNNVGVSINKAKKFLSAVQVNIDAELFDVAVLSGYNSVFCCNQALLYSKGFTERSHVCVITAVKELFEGEESLCQLLSSIDDLRFTRHKIQYSGLDADFEMCEFVRDLAKDYFGMVEKILKKN
jgi:uncharacterized protein (UPF0332 family)